MIATLGKVSVLCIRPARACFEVSDMAPRDPRDGCLARFCIDCRFVVSGWSGSVQVMLRVP